MHLGEIEFTSCTRFIGVPDGNEAPRSDNIA